MSVRLLIGGMVRRSFGWLVGFQKGRDPDPVSQYVGRSVGWLVGLSICRSVSRSDGRFSKRAGSGSGFFIYSRSVGLMVILLSLKALKIWL